MSPPPTDPPQADALLRRYRRTRSPDDFGAFFDEVSGALFRLAVRLTKHGAAAEDVLQETLLAVLRSVGDWDPRRPAMPWLTTILQRKASDAWRRRDRSPPQRRETPEDPVALAERREERDLVRDAIEDLHEPYRRVAILAWRYGLDPAAIAHALGENPSSVRSRLHRAKALLEGRLRPALLPALLLPPVPRGLASVRHDLLAAAGSLAPASATSTLVLTTGGLLMAKKALVAITLALLLVLGARSFLDEPDAEIERDDPARTASASETGAPRPGEGGSNAPAPLSPAVDLTRVDRDRDVHGRVSDEAGDPVAGARVRALRYPWRRTFALNPEGWDEHETAGAATSAADGTFAIRLRRGALVDVVVEADGFGTATVERAQAGERVDVELRPEVEPVDRPEPRWTESIRGRVTDADDGDPIAGAVVGLFWSQKHPVRSDADGRFVLPVPTGFSRNGITVSAEGYGREERAVGSRDRTIDVSLRRGDTVAGRIVGRDGAPVAGARVSAAASLVGPGGHQTGWSAGHAVTSDDGRFAITGLRRDTVHTLVVVAPDHGRALLDFDPHPAGPATIDLGDVRLPAPLAIEGVVLDAGGAPLARVDVELRGANRDRGRRRSGAAPGWEYGNVENRRTDDLGRFRFPDLAPGDYAIVAAPREPTSRATPVELDDADVLDAVVRLAAGRSITVTVLDPDGAPVAGAVVRLMALPAGVRGQTDEAGRCTLVTSPTSEVSARAWGGDAPKDARAPMWVDVPPGASEITLRFQRAMMLRARVLDAEEKPVGEGIQVVIMAGGKQRAAVFTDSEGRIVYRTSRSERVDLVLSGIWWPGTGPFLASPLAGEARGVPPGGGEVTIHGRAVAFDRTIRVRVTDPDGTPLARMPVWTSDGGAPRDAMRTTGDDGMITLTGLRPAVCTFHAGLDPARSFDGLFAPAPRRVEPDGQTLHLPVRRTVVMAGIVVDLEGRGVAATVTAAWTEEDLRVHRGTPATSDAEGRFRVLCPDDVRSLSLAATWVTPDGATAHATVAARPGTEVRLALK